jgi:hypothetical protein
VVAPARDATAAGSSSSRGVSSGINAATDGFAVFYGLYWLTANVAERRGLALAVDDVQWCDPASLQFLAYLVRRLGEIARRLNADGVPTSPGGPQWWPSTVRAVLDGRDRTRRPFEPARVGSTPLPVRSSPLAERRDSVRFTR